MSIVKLFSSEKEYDLFEMMPKWAIAIDDEKVNIEDLIASWKNPGAIIRVKGSPHKSMLFMPNPDSDAIGCVAGWISEE